MKDIRGAEIDPSIDEPTAEAPDSPSYREGINIWVWDDAGQIHFPRMGVECTGKNWRTSHQISINVTLPDGRVLTHWRDHPPFPPKMLRAGRA